MPVNGEGAATRLQIDSPNVTIINEDLKDGRSACFQIVRVVRVAYPHIRIIVVVESPGPVSDMCLHLSTAAGVPKVFVTV